ncbi:GAF domain-containing sensor histidine kinase [Nitrospira sp. Nam74]
METNREENSDAITKHLVQRERELLAARRISEALFQHLTLDDLVDRALRTAVDVVNAETGSVILADQDSHELVFRYTLGAMPAPCGTTIPDNSLAGAVFTSGEPLVVTDVKRDARHYPGVDDITGYRTRDLIALPLKRWEGKPIGVMELLNKREGRLDHEDLSILTIISGFTAIAIEQSRLFEEAKLAEVVRRLGDVSHDVKNMLMPILICAGLLQDELDDLARCVDERQVERARSIRDGCKDIIEMQVKGARRIQERVKEIVDCVKGLSTPPQFASCSLAGFIESVFEVLRRVAEERGVVLTTCGMDALPAIVADERRLFNAFYNLIDNAIAEMPTGGSLTVRGEADGEQRLVRLQFIDTGRGIPPDVLDSLFTTRTISRKPGGTGLGTKIIKDVVDMHHGHISVQSKEGMGTTFLIELPMSQ